MVRLPPPPPPPVLDFALEFAARARYRYQLEELETNRADPKGIIRFLRDVACDMIVDQQRIGFLNEHFRSRPEIIEFSNRHFYGGNLNVMTGNHLCRHREFAEK